MRTGRGKICMKVASEGADCMSDLGWSLEQSESIIASQKRSISWCMMDKLCPADLSIQKEGLERATFCATG